MKKSKWEIEIEAKLEISERQKNIKKLEDEITFSKHLYDVIKGDTLQDDNERKIVAKEIEKLQAFVASEKEIIRELDIDGPTNEDIEFAVKSATYPSSLGWRG